MNYKNTRAGYGSVARWLHWSVFSIIFFLLITGNFADEIHNTTLRGLLFTLHKSFGISLLFLTVFRILWAFNNTRPTLPRDTPKIEKWLAAFTQKTLYVLMLLMPISGWLFTSAYGHPINFFGLFTLPMAPDFGEQHVGYFWHKFHEVTAWVLIGFITLHIMGALKHHFINKDNLIKTMLPSRKTNTLNIRLKKK